MPMNVGIDLGVTVFAKNENTGAYESKNEHARKRKENFSAHVVELRKLLLNLKTKQLRLEQHIKYSVGNAGKQKVAN